MGRENGARGDERAASDDRGSNGAMKIVERKPTVMEYSQVQDSLGGQAERPEVIANIISTASFGVVAEDAVSDLFTSSLVFFRHSAW
ncbi:MAG: hypothetical protein ABUL46_00330 [Chitinophaga rupis]